MKKIYKKVVKKALSVFLVVVMLLTSAPLQGFTKFDFSWLSFNASAASYSGTCGDNVTWVFDDETGILTLDGTGEMKNYNSPSSLYWAFNFNIHPWKKYCSQIKTIIINDGITAIGNYAFARIDSLESVVIPESVLSIGTGAFGSCISLESIAIYNNETTFGAYSFGYDYTGETLYPDLLIYGTIDSSAHEYANNNGITFQCIHAYNNEVPIESDKSSLICGDVIKYTCTECGQSWDDSKAIAHDYELVSCVCDCITGGVDTYTCSRCGDTYTENFAARHADTDNDGFCDYCLNPFGGVLDLVFIIDSTGSMSDEINVVKESIQTYADMLSQSNIPHYIALVDFSNDKQNNGLNNYYNINFDFTNDEETIAKGISNLTTKGGSDEPAYSAIINGLEELHWGVNSTRRIILIGDEEPWSNETVTGYNYDKALESLQNNDISVYSIATGGTNVSSFRTLAESTNGNYYQSSDSAEFADTLIDIIDSIPESIHLHDYAETIITSATCLKDGLASYKCTGCGRELENVVLSALGHNYVSERIEATDELEEHTRFTCSRCNDSYIVLDPATPVEGLQAFAGTYTVSLSWLKSVEASVTGYKVYRKLAADTEFALIKTISSRNTTSFVDKDLTAGYEYVYVITALKDEVEGLQCDPVVCIPNADEEEPRVLKLEPSKMLNDVITGTVKFAINAEDNIGVVKFELYYSPENSGEWNLISEYKGATANISFNTKSVSDGTYSFKAIAYDAMGNSGDGSLIKTYVIDNSGPDKVTGLNTKAVYASKATIAWNNVSDKDINHFILRRKTDTGYEVVSNSITGVLGYNLEGLSPNTQYTYSVAGVDHYGNIGEYSDDFSFTTLADTTAPVVTSLSPASGRYNSSVSFKATATDDCGIASITIQTSLNGVDWEGIKTYTYSDNKTSKTCTHTISLQNYNDGPIYIRAVANDIVGNKSNTSESAPFIQYYVDKTAPSKPTGVTAVGGDGYIQIKWNRSIEDDLSGYYVYRSTAENGTFTKISGKLSTLNHYDRNVNRDTIYYYKVDVVDSCGNVSEQSAVVSAKALSDTIKPTIESISPAYGTAISANNNQIGILANDNNMLKSIVVEYKDTDDYKVLKTFDNINASNKVVYVSLPVSSYKHGDVVYLRTYCVDAAGYTSEYSSAVKYVIDKVAPGLTNLSCVINSGVCTLKWNDTNDSDLSGFKIYRSTDGGSYKSIGSRAYSSSHSYTFNDTVSEGTHTYRIDCVDKSGNTASYYSDSIKWTKPAQIKAAITSETYLEQGVQEVFSASKSTSDNSITSYLWDFGDGTTSNKINVTKSYNEAGVYTVTLTITDTEANTSTTTKVVTVAERELLGIAKVKVVNENGHAISNAPVYFDLGEENQQIVYTNTSGYASLTMTAGTHIVGSYKNGFLPVSGNITVLANTTAEITLTMVEQELITGEFEVHEMTFEEIKAAGIDVNDPANQQIYEVKVTLIYGEEKIPVTYVRNDTEIISYTIGNTGGGGGGGGGGHGGSKINHISFVPNEMNQEIIAVVEIPITASYLKQFYSANLHIVNNAAAGYEIVNCEASISVPDGLTVVQHTPISSVIDGQQSSSANWILRGDKAGSYNLSANFSGVLDSFNVPVSASFTADEPVVVYGPETVKLRMEVNEEIQYDTLYFNIGLVNQRPVNVNCPRINTVDFVKNVTEAVKNNEAVIDGDEYECELLNIRVDHGDGTCTYFEPDSTSEELAEFMNTLPPGAGLFYEYVVYDLIDYDGIAYFNKATIECAEDYFGAIEVLSMNLHKFDDTNYDAKFSNLEDDEIAVVVSDSSGEPIKRVKITYGELEERTDNDGVAIFKKSNNSATDIIAKKKGYHTYFDTINIDEQDKNYFLITLYSEDESLLSLKKCIYKSDYATQDILHKYKQISKLNKGEFTITCEPILNENIDRYELWCTGELIATSDNGVFADLYPNDMKIGKGYGVKVISKDNNDSEITNINLEVVDDKVVDKFSLKLSSSGSKISLPDTIPFIGGTVVDIDMISDYIPVSFYLEEDKLYVGVNIDFDNDPEKSVSEKFGEFTSKISQFKKGSFLDPSKIDEYNLKSGSLKAIGLEQVKTTTMSLPASSDFNIEILGGGAINKDANQMEIGLLMVINYKVGKEWITFVQPIWIPVSVGFEFEVTGKFNPVIKIDTKNIKFDFNLSGSLEPKLGGLVGIGSQDIIFLGLYGGAGLNVDFNLIDPEITGIKDVDLTGELAIRGKFFGAEGHRVFAHNTWHIYHRESTYSLRSSSSNSTGSFMSPLYDVSLYNAEDLSYIVGNKNRSVTKFEPHNENEVENNDFIQLVKNAYSVANPSMVANSTDTIMTYVAVNDSTEIMFSTYDSVLGQWGLPIAIDDSDFSEYSPKLIEIDDEIYVVFQRRTSTKSFDEMSTEEYFSNMELCVYKFNSETRTFDYINSVAKEGAYIASAELSKIDGKLFVVFVANNSNDPIGINGGEICAAEIQRGINSDPSVIEITDKQITSIAAKTTCDNLSVMYTVENDQEYNTNNRTIYHISSTGEKGQVYTGQVSRLKYADIPLTGESGFVWNASGNIYYSIDEVSTEVLIGNETEISVLGDFDIVGNDIIFVANGDSDDTDLYIAKHTADGYIKAIKINDNSKYVGSFSAVLTDYGMHIMLLDKEVTIASNDIQEYSEISWSLISDKADVVLYGASYDLSSVKPNVNLPVELNVFNAGTKDINDMDIEVYCDEQVIVKEKITGMIHSGQEIVIKIDVPMSKDIELEKYKVVCQIPDDSNDENNYHEFEIGYADLAIESYISSCKDNRYMMIEVENIGGTHSGGTINIYVNDNESIVKTIDFLPLAPGENGLFEVELDKELFAGENSGYITAKLVTTEEDYNDFNNTSSNNVDYAVYGQVTQVKISDKQLALKTDESYELSARVSPDKFSVSKRLNWTSDDESVVIVDGKGVITAVGPGKTVVTVTTVDGGFTDSCEISVTCAEHSWGDWIVDKESTCINLGAKHQECINCGNINEETIDVLEHFGGIATCTEKAICAVCNLPYGEINANNHDIITLEGKPATCTETGYEAYEYCTVCDYTTYKVINALNHKDTLKKVEGKPATCTEAGYEAYEYCTACDYTTYKVINALNHKDTLKKVTGKLATCTEEGYEAYEYCTACDYTTYKTIEVAGHTPLEAVTKNEVAPKCGVAGSYDSVVYCDVCDAEISRKTIVVDALTHADTNNDYKCDNGCGYEYENPADTCSHLCHKSGFVGFIWKIVRFFWKLFKMNPICKCGTTHY